MKSEHLSCAEHTPTLKYVVQPQDDNEHTGGAN